RARSCSGATRARSSCSGTAREASAGSASRSSASSRVRPPALAALSVVGLWLVLLGTTQAATPSRLDAASKRFTEPWRTKAAAAGVVGGHLFLVQDGNVVGRAPYGLADRAAGRPVDDDTIFHWASITKTFTAIAILQLRDRGLLTLDDPVVKYLP